MPVAVPEIYRLRSIRYRPPSGSSGYSGPASRSFSASMGAAAGRLRAEGVQAPGKTSAVNDRHVAQEGPRSSRSRRIGSSTSAAAYRVTDSQTGEHIGSLRRVCGRRSSATPARDPRRRRDRPGEGDGRQPVEAYVRRTIELAAMLLPQAYHIEIDGQVGRPDEAKFLNIFVHKLDASTTRPWTPKGCCSGRSPWPASSLHPGHRGASG